MINYTIEELQKALKDFDENPLRYENLDIDSAYIAIDCIRYCIMDRRKAEKMPDFNESRNMDDVQYTYYKFIEPLEKRMTELEKLIQKEGTKND